MKLGYSVDCKADVMVEMLMLNPLSDEFISVDIGPYKPGHDNIIISLKRAFYSHEENQIVDIVNSYSNNHPLVIRKQLEEQVSMPAMIAGQAIMAKYAAMNLSKNKSLEQYLTIFELTKTLIAYLQSGSLEMAQYELNQIKQNLPANGAMTADECDEFLRRLDVEIKRLKG